MEASDRSNYHSYHPQPLRDITNTPSVLGNNPKIPYPKEDVIRPGKEKADRLANKEFTRLEKEKLERILIELVGNDKFPKNQEIKNLKKTISAIKSFFEFKGMIDKLKVLAMGEWPEHIAYYHLGEKGEGFKILQSGNCFFLRTSLQEGRGIEKTAKTAYEILTKESNPDELELIPTTVKLSIKIPINSNLVSKIEKITNELKMQNLFEEHDSFIHIIDSVFKEKPEKNHIKCEILVDRCDYELFKVINLADKNEEYNKSLATVFKKILKGLCELNNKGIHHRDLKPENILITNRGDPKISDFGFAISAEDERKYWSTPQASLCGTPMYLAPERVIGYNLIKGFEPFKRDLGCSIKKINQTIETLKCDINLAENNRKKHSLLDRQLYRTEQRLKGYQRTFDIPKEEAMNLVTNSKSDLFSVAIILYFTLSGKHFYDCTSHEQLFDKIKSLTQEEIRRKLNLIKPKDQFEQVMFELLQDILILDVNERPTAEQALSKYTILLSDLEETTSDASDYSGESDYSDELD